MSVDIAPLTSVEESYERARQSNKDAVASLKAGDIMSHAQEVEHCPTQVCGTMETLVCNIREDCQIYQDSTDPNSLRCVNPAHGCVIGKKTKAIARAIAKSCKVEIYPSEP